MIHKILIYISYDEIEYRSYLHGVLLNDNDVIKDYFEDESETFLNTIIKRTDFTTGDVYDLYLAKEKNATDEEFKANINRLKLIPISESTWTQEEAYKIISEKLGFSKLDISDLQNELFRNNVNDSIEDKREDYSNFSREKSDDIEIRITEKNKTATKKQDKLPSLAELMREIQK